ncbi:MAG: hypothetical protein KDK78_08470, partial [Chlamydiia bacterium]|nr:hypothetical protein [Chlamydiia bacterium]
MAPWVIAGLAGVAIGVGAYQTGIKLYPDSLMSYIRGGNLVEPCPEPTLMNRAQEMLGAGVERLRASVVRRGAIPFSIAEYLPASTREWLYDTP